jgi:hypothetical protein
MTNLSNLYIEKVLSEHPIATWVLGDDLGYISLLSETNRKMQESGQWTLTHSTASIETSPPGDEPFPNSNTSKIIGSVPSSSFMDILETSIFSLDSTKINSSLGNLTIGFYVYINNPYTTAISLGYQYYNTGTLSNVSVIKTIPVTSSNTNSWLFVSGVFDLPTVAYSTVKLLVGMTVKSGGGSGDYNFYINGLSAGQWSEDFNRTSLGITLDSIPTTIALPDTLKTITAKQYSTYQNNAYYLSNSSTLFAKNFGIPLVYGSSNVTKLYENKIDTINYPSIIFPGHGFLNERGKYNSYTAEMWIRLNTDTNTPRKIFGSISSEDGLYADGGFLSLVIGSNFSSHYVGEWNRPMLLDIRFIKNNASVLLNGEEIISITLDETSISFPSEFNIDGKSQDWLGFYCYDDVHPFELDSFALYSYSVPVEVAKRRWVWGQAVLPPEATNYSTNATTAFNDYSFANYSSNYNYPDFANWNQGFFSNVNTSKQLIQLPDYKLPIFYLDEIPYDTWIQDIHDTQEDDLEKYFTFRPTPSWDEKNCYILFNRLDILNEDLKMFYGVFESDGTSDNEILFKIVNKNTKDYFICSLTGTDVTYSFNISGSNQQISVLSIETNEDFVCGLNLSQISNLSGFPEINNFFSIPSNLSLYVGGDGSRTYTGLIHKFGFNAEYNTKKISSTFIDDYGIFKPDTAIGNTMINHVANYTLTLLYKYDLLFADISVAGYWEDYIPLSYFGKTTKKYNGKEYYDLDSIQVNLDYPEPMEKSSTESTGSWTYQDLKIRYQTIDDSFYLQSYGQLDNNIYNGWDNYQDMSEDSQKYYVYNTSNNSVKAYISFQKVIDGANKNLVDFDYIQSMPISGVIEPDSSQQFWENVAFEVIDGAIIYAPKQDIDLDYDLNFNEWALVSHIDFSSDGILHNPIKFRDLQFASKVLERDDFSIIGTKFGTSLYPYRKTGVYYDFKGKNPISTYKGSTPHLYLNNNTGWQFKGSFSPLIERGLSMPVNSQQGIDYRVSSVQVWLKFSETVFPTSANLIMSIDHKNSIYDFYLIGDASTQRGLIYGIDRTTGNALENIVYSINGNLVDTPYIVNENWSVLGIGFSDLLDFSEYGGRINITGQLIFNNLSYYLANNLQQNQQIQSRVWSEVKATSATWTDWKTPLDLNSDGDYLDTGEHDGTWRNLDIIGTSAIYNISPDTIYNHYVGVDRIIVDDAVDGILVNPEKIKIYSGPNWSISLKTPA